VMGEPPNILQLSLCYSDFSFQILPENKPDYQGKGGGEAIHYPESDISLVLELTSHLSRLKSGFNGALIFLPTNPAVRSTIGNSVRN